MGPRSWSSRTGMAAPTHRAAVRSSGAFFHRADRGPYRRLNDVICVSVGEARAPGDPSQAGPDLVIGAAKPIWEPTAD
jgi:hypothetical protein